MKNIGILTINDYNNYGNRLQNYALQELLKSLGVTVTTVVNKSNYKIPSTEKTSLFKRIRLLYSLSINEINRKLYNRIWRLLNKKKLTNSASIRWENFINFSETNINESNFYITEEDLQLNKLKDFDYFVTGSDQVWNPNFRYGSSIDFLAFAPSEKRISYAASFGISQIPEEYISDYSLLLSEMSYVSYIEEEGDNIV